MIDSFFIFISLFLCGIIMGSLLGTLCVRFIPKNILKIIGLITLLPLMMVSFFIYIYLRDNLGASYFPIIYGVLNSPIVMFPCVARYLSLPSGTERAALGLGATPSVRLQKLWFPLLAVPLTISVCITVFVIILYRAFW